MLGNFYTFHADCQDLCQYHMEGIFRIGPANLEKLNLIGQGFKFFPNMESNVDSGSYNLLLLGGSAKPIDKSCPPSLGDIEIYSSNTSFVDKSENKDVAFLSRAFSDLVQDPTILDTSEFVKESNIIYFKFNSQLQEAFLKVKHTATLIENMRDIINYQHYQIQNQNQNQKYELGHFEIVNDHAIKIRLGTIYLLDDVIISNYADRYLFFQHNLLHMKSKKKNQTKPTTTNENLDGEKKVCTFFRRVKYLFTK